MFGELEKEWEGKLPQHSFAAIRLDGKGFSKFTREMRKDGPFNQEFNKRMLFTTQKLLDEVDGVYAALVGSDEISLIIQDMPEKSEKWFGGRTQKITSVSASVAAAAFNHGYDSMAFFDARVFDLGQDEAMVVAYLQDRLGSIVKNSVSMWASAHFSHRELQGMSVRERRELLEREGFPWEGVGLHDRYGTLFFKAKEEKAVEFTFRGELRRETVLRSVWKTLHPETSAQVDRPYLH